MTVTWMFILQYIGAPLFVAFVIWIAASTVWLVSRVVTQRHEMEKFRLEMDLEISKIKNNCSRHQLWAKDMQKSIGRMDRNVVLLCAKSGVNYEESKT